MEKLTLLQKKIIKKQASKIVVYRKSIRLFIYDMWRLKPQPIKPEYQERMDEIEKATFKEFERLKKTVKAEWYGVCDEGEGGAPNFWRWDSFKKGFRAMASERVSSRLQNA